MSPIVYRMNAVLSRVLQRVPVGVTDCNRNEPGLQSARFWDHINCLYRPAPDHINCH